MIDWILSYTNQGTESVPEPLRSYRTLLSSRQSQKQRKPIRKLQETIK